MDLVVKGIVERIDVRIAVSPAALEYPARMFPGAYRVIPNGVPVEKYAPAVGAAKVPGRVLFIGRAERRKGLRGALEAFARLRRRRPDATLVIAGANRRQVVDAVRAAQPVRADGLRVDLTGVEPLGWVDDAEKVRRLGEAEVVCAPSLTAESFGIVLAEAMAAGVPVVASDLPGYRAVLQDGAGGRLVAPEQAGAARRGAGARCSATRMLRSALAAAGLGSRAAALVEQRHRRDPARPTRTPWPVGDRPGVSRPARQAVVRPGDCSSTRLASAPDGAGPPVRSADDGSAAPTVAERAAFCRAVRRVLDCRFRCTRPAARAGRQRPFAGA